MKLRNTLLICAFLGALLLWILEIMRVGFKNSYDLLLLALVFLFAFQYFRVRDQQRNKDVSPTISQMIDKRKKDAQHKGKKQA